MNLGPAVGIGVLPAKKEISWDHFISPWTIEDILSYFCPSRQTKRDSTVPVPIQAVSRTAMSIGKYRRVL